MNAVTPATAAHQARAAALSAAATLALVVPDEDVSAVVTHLELLRQFAVALGDPADELAAVLPS